MRQETATERVKQWFGNLVLLAISLGLAILGAEWGLRLWGFSNVNFFGYDEYTGITHRPFAEGWYRSEGNAYITINSHGFRDKEHTFEKPANVKRIAILGDSFAEALQVATENTYWSLLEARLNECHAFGEAPIEVLNFGVSGFGTLQELLTLQHRVWAFSPDVVMLSFFAANDIRNNSKTLEPDKLRPFLQPDAGIDYGFRDRPEYRRGNTRFWQSLQTLTQHSRILQLVNLARKNYAAAANAVKSSEGAEAGLSPEILREPNSSEWQEAWRLTESLVKMIQDETQKHNAELRLVALPNAIQVHPDPKVREDFLQAQGAGSDLSYADNRIAALADRAGIINLTLAPELLNLAESEKVFLHGFANTKLGTGHLNERGHKAVAELLAEQLCNKKPLAKR